MRLAALAPPLAVLVIESAAGTACRSFDADPADAAAGDAAAADAEAADAAPPKNLVDNADFENGCTHWTPYKADLTSVSGRGTGLACHACKSGLVPLFSVGQTSTGGRAVPGTTYTGEMWVRGVQAPAPGTVGTTAKVAFRTRDTGAQGNKEYAELALALTGDWQRFSVRLPVSQAADNVDFYAFIEGPAAAAPGVCFDVDDARVVVAPTAP
jgi:hypothetical protein